MKSFAKLNENIEEGYKELVSFLQEHGGFVDAGDHCGDRIYAYDYFTDVLGDYGAVHEMNCLAVRLHEDDVEIFLTPYGSREEVKDWDAVSGCYWDEFYNGKCFGYWASLRHSDVLWVFTLYNILEVIEEFVREIPQEEIDEMRLYGMLDENHE